MKMIVTIEYDTNSNVIDIMSKYGNESHRQAYYHNSNWYDMCEKLENFISNYIEEEG